MQSRTKVNSKLSNVPYNAIIVSRKFEFDAFVVEGEEMGGKVPDGGLG